jgi:osmotically-inducible protein OsmY
MRRLELRNNMMDSMAFRKTGRVTFVQTLMAMLVLMGVMGFKGPSSTMADHELQAILTQRLAMDGRINAKAMEVHVDNGTATLAGTVDTLAEKAFAENLVVSTYGVTAVKNELMVRPAPTKDFAIEQTVKEALKSTPALQTSPIQVSVRDGIVILKGTVQQQSQSRAAERAVNTIPGLVRVVNMIKVRQPRPDRDIETDVVFYLQSSSLVNLDDVDYVVKDGAVTLRGTIDNLTHKYAIADDVEKIHGVKTVDVNGISVKDPRRSDSAVLQGGGTGE